MSDEDRSNRGEIPERLDLEDIDNGNRERGQPKQEGYQKSPLAAQEFLYDVCYNIGPALR